MHSYLLLLFLLVSATVLQAQTPPRYFWAGFSANNYLGDLDDGLPHYSPAIHLGLKLNRASRLNGNFGLAYGRVNGQNPDFSSNSTSGAQPNQWFNTSFFTLDYSLQYHLIRKERYFVYLSQGIGLFRYNPKDEQDRNLLTQYSTRPTEESYGNISLQLPAALGAGYLLPNQWGIILQASYLNPLTDYIDNISSLGLDKGNDNILQFRLMVLVPIKAKPIVK